MSLEFFYDCSSPWTYLAWHNVQLLADELEIAVTWRPFLVGGVFNAVNRGVYAQRADPVSAKDAYHRKDLADWAAQAGLGIIFPPSVFPVNTVKAMRMCLVLAPLGRELDFARGVFEAYWTHDQDVSRDEVLSQICDLLGLDGRSILAAQAEPAIKARLRASTDEAIRRGAFGSPTIFVDGTDMYFGNDRLGLVRQAILRGRTQVAAD